MSFIYTHNTSPRKLKRVVKNKSYYEAVEKQNKLLCSIGIDPHRTIRRDSFKVMPLEQVGMFKSLPNILDSISAQLRQEADKKYKCSLQSKDYKNEECND